jgi:hypothetical protein
MQRKRPDAVAGRKERPNVSLNELATFGHGVSPVPDWIAGSKVSIH